MEARVCLYNMYICLTEALFIGLRQQRETQDRPYRERIHLCICALLIYLFSRFSIKARTKRWKEKPQQADSLAQKKHM